MTTSRCSVVLALLHPKHAHVDDACIFGHAGFCDVASDGEAGIAEFLIVLHVVAPSDGHVIHNPMVSKKKACSHVMMIYSVHLGEEKEQETGRKGGGVNRGSPVMLVVKEHAFLKEIQVGFILGFSGAVFFGAHVLTRLIVFKGKLEQVQN